MATRIKSIGEAPITSDSISTVTQQYHASLLERISKLEARNDNIKQFTYMVIHDMKHPTESVVQMISYLERELYNTKVLLNQTN